MKNILSKRMLVLSLAFLALFTWTSGSAAQQIFFEDNIQVAQESEFPSSGNDVTGKLKRIIRLTADEADGTVTIEIQGTDKLEYTAFKLLNPLRIVLDLPDMELGDLETQEIAIDKGVVNSMQPVYFEDTKVLRLEIGLNVAASYEISQDVESQLLVQLQKAPQETLALEPGIEDLEDPQLPPVEEEPQAIQPPEPVEEEAQVIQPPEPVEEAAQAIQPPEPVEEEAADISPVDTPLEVEEEMPDAQASARTSEPGLMDPCSDEESSSFKRISFDFQNANLKNIIRIIAEVAGFNVVLSQDVKGTTNVKMTDVPWNKALELILSNNGLARECEGIIMRVATEATLEATREEGVLVTEMIRINYADLDQIVSSLAGIKSERGSIKNDERTSTLIVTDVQEIIRDMREVIKKLDIPSQQVTIAMQIVEIETTAAKEFGIGWGVDSNSTTSFDFPHSLSIGSSVGATADLDSGIADQFSADMGTPFQVDLASAINPTGSVIFALANRGLGTILNMELRALESRGLSKTLSRPKVTTLDNTEARIRKGLRIPFRTSTANEGETVEFYDADLELNVTPHITAEEKIFLKIAATKNSVGAAQEGAIGRTILTSEANTEVLVENGSTTVLGGLTSNAINETKRAIPFLGDLPWIGWMFRNSVEDSTVDELLIFITPTIVRN